LQRISAKAFRNDADIISKKITANGVPIERFENINLQSDEVILYFHGGGYVYGSTDTHRAFINRIANRTGKTVISVDYRLAPENPFPAATDDAFTVYNWLINSENYPSNNIILMGDSAGGTLCTSILFQLKKLNLQMPKTAVLISPWVQPYAEGESIDTNDEYDIGGQPFLIDCANRYLNNENVENPLVTPIFGNFSGFPPMLVQVGTCEVLLSQIRTFVEKGKAEKVDINYIEYEDMFHTFLISNPNVPQSETALEDIGNYLSA